MAITSSTGFKIFNVASTKAFSALTDAQKVAGALYVQGNDIFLYDGSNFSVLSGVTVGTSAPTNPLVGSQWIDTTDGKNILKIYTGSAWAEPKPSAAVAADKLSSGAKIAITDASSVTAGTMSSNWDGSADGSISMTALNAALLTGTIPSAVVVSTGTSTTSPIATESYVTSAIATAATSVMHYKGTIASTTALAAVTTAVVGDVYNVSANGDNYAYTELAGDATPGGTAGTEYIAAGTTVSNGHGYWEKLGATIDLSNYANLDGAQTITGAKTFTAAITASAGVTGDVTGNASTATKLATARKISIKTGATAAGVDFDGSAAIELEVTALDASKLGGAIPSSVTATTQTAGNNSTAIATTAYVDAAVATGLSWSIIS